MAPTNLSADQYHTCPEKRLTAKFKKGDRVIWDALWGRSGGWIVQGLDEKDGVLIPSYHVVQEGSGLQGSAMQDNLELETT